MRRRQMWKLLEPFAPRLRADSESQHHALAQQLRFRSHRIEPTIPASLFADLHN